MSLDIAKLEKVREMAGGLVQARCPACAEGGHDRTGEHLRIYPDGRFGCCVHPKDGEHRKRIWALAGCKLHLSPAESVSLRLKTPPALPSLQSVKNSLTGCEFGTLGTAEVKLCARAREDSTTTNIDTANILEKLKDSDSAVLTVPPPVIADERLPFLTACGDLSIPFDSPERYHWWRGGQSVAATLAEVKERMKNAIAI
jgi:hypothetical protein